MDKEGGEIKTITAAIYYKMAVINLWMNRQAGKMDRERERACVDTHLSLVISHLGGNRKYRQQKLIYLQIISFASQQGLKVAPLKC